MQEKNEIITLCDFLLMNMYKCILEQDHKGKHKHRLSRMDVSNLTNKPDTYIYSLEKLSANFDDAIFLTDNIIKPKDGWFLLE